MSVKSRVVLFTKHGCHLCELVEDELKSILGGTPGFAKVDIGEDGEAHDRYWLRIPVVVVEGEAVFEAPMMDRDGRWRETLLDLIRRRMGHG